MRKFTLYSIIFTFFTPFSIWLEFIYHPSRLAEFNCDAPIPAVQAVAREILTEDFLGKFGTAPATWLDIFIERRQEIKSWSQADKIVFYTILLIHLDLDTETAYIFAETVGKDSLALHRHLNRIIHDEKFKDLSDRKRNNIMYWSSKFAQINELGDV
ncbi:hypothetical protein [Parachitinimonas caeni]|uniref:Uncharacterized protein n=1 Tax=Parachitinimonas caeni TaxID=3031301 RepID=A0ABT7E0U0_9NEIS|nr:hypothetical protein [Parachitinimonas caeni]MDK2125927.1 hypothetical protein [Parachitinimonas caeni]